MKIGLFVILDRIGKCHGMLEYIAFLNPSCITPMVVFYMAVLFIE